MSLNKIGAPRTWNLNFEKQYMENYFKFELEKDFDVSWAKGVSFCLDWASSIGENCDIIVDKFTSMMVTDVGDEMCWWHLKDVVDSFGHFGHQHLRSFYIGVGHQHWKDVTNIEIQSPTSTNRHQL